METVDKNFLKRYRKKKCKRILFFLDQLQIRHANTLKQAKIQKEKRADNNKQSEKKRA